MASATLSDSLPPNCGDMALAFQETLIELLPMRNGSDRTCFHRITQWLRQEVEAGRREPRVFQEVLVWARECRTPGVRNPNALFLSLLKKELGYDPKRS